MTSKEDETIKEIPEIIYDSGSRISYKRGRFFGKVCMKSILFYCLDDDVLFVFSSGWIREMLRDN